MNWQSKKYPEFLRRKDCKFCGKPLEQDGYEWELHHANHSRGSSAFYARMCRQCHSKLHENESWFNKVHKMDRAKWYKHCMEEMSYYVDSLGKDSTMVCIEALARAAEENE